MTALFRLWFLFSLIALVVFASSCNNDKDDPNPNPQDTTQNDTTGNDTLNQDSLINDQVYEVTDQTQPAPDGSQRAVVVVNGTEHGIGANVDRTWTKDTIYVLNGYVFVQEGQTLTIEPGTVIKGRPSPTNGDAISALVVARGGTINAAGTASEPIIFTSENDDVSDPDDLAGASLRGQWGGVIILGAATTNTSAGSYNNIEGIDITELRGLYGGNNDNDNSGVFRYVSIRHGGQDLGAGNEINGLTMGAVGSGTTIDHVEVIYNADDGFEWFGGTVNTKHLVAAFCGDDGFDYDQGYRGQNQFWYCIQEPGVTGNGGEHDGGTDPETGSPYAIPVIYNATYVSTPSLTTTLINMRDNAGGKYFNSVFAGFADGLQIEDLSSGEDAWARFQAGDIEFVQNVWQNIGTLAFVYDDDDAMLTTQISALENYLTTNNSVSGGNIAPWSGTNYDPRPTGTAATTGMAVRPNHSFIQTVSYRGAFAPGQTTWVSGWTFISQQGFHVD